MKNRILYTLGIVLISGHVIAQNKAASDTVQIVKEYEPTLIDANKIEFAPEIDDKLKIDVDLKYQFLNKQVPVFFQLEPISPAKIKGEPLVKLYNGYARVGVGNALIPFGEVYYNNKRSKTHSIGGHAQYWNNNAINDIEDSDRSKLFVQAFGKRFWKKNTLDARVSFDQDQLNYYGFNTDARIEAIESSGLQRPDLGQTYNRINGKVRLKSTKVDSFNIRHDGSLSYNLLTNTNSNAENNIKANLNLSQFKNSELYNLDVLIDYNSYDLGESNTIIGLEPKISTIGDQFKIEAGLGAYVDASSSSSFHFYPLAEIKYNVIDDILVPYLGVRGEVRRVNYHSITLENPFVSENLELRNTNERYNLYAGLRGTLSKKVSFNVSGARLNTEDAYLFVQAMDADLFASQEYSLIYDDIKETQLKGELIVRMSESLTISALGRYFSFDQENQEEVWHRPNLKIAASAAYNLKRKLLMRADINYWGEQYARTVERIDENNVIGANFGKEKLDGIIDANLSFEYRYTKRLSAYIQFNNIAGINYEKYKDYPTQGFNVLGGFTYGF